MSILMDQFTIKTSCTEAPSFLWIDLRGNVSSRSYYQDAREMMDGYMTENPVPDEYVVRHRPSFVCFEFDFPTIVDLEALKSFMARHGSLPTLMITEFHTETLAIWALRSRVWDYIVKPIEQGELADRIKFLTNTDRLRGDFRPNLFPSRRVPKPADFLPLYQQKTYAAVRFIHENYAQKISLSTLARVCNLSPSSCSRIFKKEHNVNISAFILIVRIKEAQELLKLKKYSISEAAYKVGFNDLSYFSKMFRRYLGHSPSTYRDHEMAKLGESRPWAPFSPHCADL